MPQLPWHAHFSGHPLTYREIFWYRVARANEQADSLRLLQDLERNLLSAGDSKTRGGLVNRASQLGFIVGAGVPMVSGSPLTAEEDPVWMALQASC